MAPEATNLALRATADRAGGSEAADRARDEGSTVLPIEQVIDQYGTVMFRVARSIVGDVSLAEDVVQDALVRVWQNAEGYRGDAPFKNWVMRITHNCAISALRKRRDESRDPSLLAETEVAATIDTERSIAGRAAVEELWTALDRLDQTTRTIVVLREIERMSYEDISEMLDLPLPTIKTRLFRARKTLSEHLKEWR